MNNNYILSILRDALTRRKKMEDQVRESLEPIMPTLRFIAEVNKIYRDVYGEDETTLDEVEIPLKVENEAKKPKIKKDTLHGKPKVELPTGAKWDDVTITFKNSQDVTVKYKDISIGTFSHEQLGFARSNTQMSSPNKLWLLLEMLAVAEEFESDKKIIMTKDYLMSAFKAKSPNVIEKQKSSLSMSLRQAFGIHEEPFEPYTHELGYRPKFKLRPEPQMRGSGELHPSGHGYTDIYSED